jgi:hypothetical protein
VNRVVLGTRVLMQRASAAVYLWDSRWWECDFDGFEMEMEQFRRIFQSKQNAGHMGKGLARV